MSSGLTPLVKNGTSRSEIQPFPPGQFESYSLGSGGKATLVSRGTFHVVGEDPIYKTATNHAGRVIQKAIVKSMSLTCVC